MLKTDKAAARLQHLWDTYVKDDPRTIKKVVGEPKSSGAVGWTWAAIKDNGEWFDLGYTEKQAAGMIRHWDTPLGASIRKSRTSTEELNAAIDKFNKILQKLK